MRKFFEKEEGDLTKGSLPVNIQLFAHEDDDIDSDEADDEVDHEGNPDGDGKEKDDRRRPYPSHSYRGYGGKGTEGSRPHHPRGR